jgi:hypothetical protein
VSLRSALTEQCLDGDLVTGKTFLLVANVLLDLAMELGVRLETARLNLGLVAGKTLNELLGLLESLLISLDLSR